MVCIADRDVQFVRGYDVQPWVAVLPPELMTDGDNLDGICRREGLLNVGNYPSRCHEQRHNDQDGNDSPGDLNLIATVHLRWLTAIVACPSSEFHDSVAEQGEHDHEYGCRHDQHEERQSEDRLGWRRNGREDIRGTHRRNCTPFRLAYALNVLVQVGQSIQCSTESKAIALPSNNRAILTAQMIEQEYGTDNVRINKVRTW